jgi:hypothetical protein
MGTRRMTVSISQMQPAAIKAAAEAQGLLLEHLAPRA